MIDCFLQLATRANKVSLFVSLILVDKSPFSCLITESRTFLRCKRKTLLRIKALRVVLMLGVPTRPAYIRYYKIDPETLNFQDQRKV